MDEQLAALLADMTDRLDVLEDDRNQLARDSAAQSTSLKSVLEGMETLGERLAEAEKRAREKEVDWASVTSWADQATAEQWDSLVTWVDWMVATYQPREKTLLRPCWPLHPGVVEELAALWEAWLVARASMAKKPTDQMGYWHDRLLHPTLAHIEKWGLATACRNGHVEPKIPPMKTDRDLLPEPTVQLPVGPAGQGRDVPPPPEPTWQEEPPMDEEPPWQ